MKVAYILLFSLGAVNAHPQFLSKVESFLGISDKSSPTAKSLVPATTLSPTSTNTVNLNPTIKSTSGATRPSSTGTTFATITTSSQSLAPTSNSTNSSTITSAPTTSSSTTQSITLTSSPTPATTTSTTSPSSSSSSVSPGGIAVAVLLTLAILLAAAWLTFRYNPRVRAWWLRREEKKMQERSYRAALDGPFSGGSSAARSQALGTRKSMMASFFAPRTVKLGNGKEIRRKPVNWGATSETHHNNHPTVAELPGSTAMEKVALTDMAAPMARSGSLISYQSSSVASPTMAQKELPAIPEASSRPPLPPIPPMPPNKPGNVHKILSRKSIFELA